MSDVKFFYPANRLAGALRKGSPGTVSECLNRAGENLHHIAEACLGHLDDGLDLLEATLCGWPEKQDASYLRTLYLQSVKLIGVGTVAGLPDIDRVARSLCDVIDGLITRELWEREPVQVHLAAMRLLRKPNQLGAGSSDVIEGLQRIRKRFAVEPVKAPKP